MDISVVFTTRNRSRQLRETLEYYQALDTTDIKWELIVVDNGSDDDTAAVLNQAADTLPLRSHYHPIAGQNRARNQVIDSLKGDLLVFSDDDALPEKDCLQAYLKAAADWPDDGIFGAHIIPRFPAGAPDWMSDLDSPFARTAFGHYQPSHDETAVRNHPYGPSFAIRRNVFGSRRFPEHLGPQEGMYATGGEAKILRNLRDEGHRFIFVPSAKVWHVVRPEQITLEWLFKRAHKRGRGQAHMPSSTRRGGLQWRGASMKLRSATVRSWIRFNIFAAFMSAQKRAEYGFRYELRNGELQELVLLEQSRGKH